MCCEPHRACHRARHQPAGRHRLKTTGRSFVVACWQSPASCRPFPGSPFWPCFTPLLLALSTLSERIFGKGFSALGFLPAVLALALYSMLPVLRNTVTGLNGVDARLSEAARVVGVPPWQLLRDIELPLALPVIMAGIRTSAVWVIGTATLATPIGQTSLATTFSLACRHRIGSL